MDREGVRPPEGDVFIENSIQGLKSFASASVDWNACLSTTYRKTCQRVLVSHEMRFARDVGTKLVFMHHGKVHEEGAKILFTSPDTAELAQFIGSIDK